MKIYNLKDDARLTIYDVLGHIDIGTGKEKLILQDQLNQPYLVYKKEIEEYKRSEWFKDHRDVVLELEKRKLSSAKDFEHLIDEVRKSIL